MASDDNNYDDDDDDLTEVDRAIGVVLDSMVSRALEHRRDVADVLVILLRNMHPLDATRSVCDAALSPHAQVRKMLCDALARDINIVGRKSALEFLKHDLDPDVRHAATRAMRG